MRFMKLLKVHQLYEVAFFIVCGVISWSMGYDAAVYMLVSFILMMIFSYLVKGKEEIYRNKTLISAFIIPYFLLAFNGVMTAAKIYGRIGIDAEYARTILKILQLIIVLVLLKKYAGGLKTFNFNISKRQSIFFIPFCILLAAALIFYQGSRLYTEYNGNIIQYLIYIVKIITLAGFYEELLFRGVLISVLRGYNMSDWKICILQAVLFGVAHSYQFVSQGIVTAVLITSSHTLIGYFLGKVYYKTRSILPSIIIHTIWDII